MSERIKIFDDQIRSVPGPRKSVAQSLPVLGVGVGASQPTQSACPAIAMDDGADAKRHGRDSARMASSAPVQVAPEFADPGVIRWDEFTTKQLCSRMRNDVGSTRRGPHEPRAWK